MAVEDLPESLRNNREFRRVYERGRRYSTPYFNAFILRTDSSNPRFGLTVTRKIGNAVVRNRCKRRLRQIISRFFRELRVAGVPTGAFDLVLNVRSALPDAEFRKLDESFRMMMQRVLNLSVEAAKGDQDEGGSHSRPAES
ncbi:MAG: ribonuclease P protein component [Acidobacteria bacterium]|nr:ribonuclease P protein component [Acidobacteriota bacterium]